MPTKKGSLIVIDGIDGTGKATQTKLLYNFFKKNKVPVAKIDFPQYYNNFFGELIGECLAGKHGDFISYSPHIGSILYAADRFESSVKIHKWLNEGRVVIIDRYVSSNQVHQGGKIATNEERKKFLYWLDTLEHKIFKIPRPDAIVYLSLPVSVSRALLEKQKGTKKGLHKKRYLKNAKDHAEENIEHLEASRRNALQIIKELNNWHEINCIENDKLISIESVHDKVKKVLSPLIKKTIKKIRI